MKPLSVCHVTKNICPRAVKLAYCQQKIGVKTHLICGHPPTFQKTLPFDKIEQTEFIRFGGAARSMARLHKDVDLYHVHTHQHDLMMLTDAISHAGRPIIWDIHDKPIFVPDKAPEHRIGAVEVLSPEGHFYHTYCPKDWFIPETKPNYDIAIATGLSDVQGHHRYWLDVFKSVKRQKLKLKCWTGSMVTDEYRVAAEMHHAVDVLKLLEFTSKAKAGLCGSPHPDDNMLSAHPNKLYEYIAAGIPVICIGDEHDMAETIKKWRIGVVIEDPYCISPALKIIEEQNIRQQVLDVRECFTMDKQLQDIMAYYRLVVGESHGLKTVEN